MDVGRSSWYLLFLAPCAALDRSYLLSYTHVATWVRRSKGVLGRPSPWPSMGLKEPKRGWFPFPYTPPETQAITELDERLRKEGHMAKLKDFTLRALASARRCDACDDRDEWGLGSASTVLYIAGGFATGVAAIVLGTGRR